MTWMRRLVLNFALQKHQRIQRDFRSLSRVGLHQAYAKIEDNMNG
jgi:hypothetical protein